MPPVSALAQADATASQQSQVVVRHIVVMPPHRSWPALADLLNRCEPDREEPFRLMAQHGFSYRRLDPHGRPWNPFARAHSILCAIDPLRALRVLLLHRHADVVLCHYESAALLILLWRGLFRFAGKVVVYDLAVADKWRLRRVIQRLVLPRADLLLPLETNQIADLVARGARPHTINPVRDATNTDFYPDTTDQPDGYILAVGDDLSRDYPLLLEVASRLACKVVIRSSLIKEDRDAFPNVTVIPDRLRTVDYRTLIAGAILVVIPLHPSLHPGGITALLEAMSSGKAVIVSASPGLADHTVDGENCRLVQPGNPAMLRHAIESLLTDPQERMRLGASARRFVVQNCSAEADAARFADLLRKLLGPARIESAPDGAVVQAAR